MATVDAAFPPATVSRAAQPPPVRELLPLDGLVLDAGTQVRLALSPAVVCRCVEALGRGDSCTAVVVFRADGRDVLADGFQRVAAYRKAGRSEIPADVRLGSVADALWFALGANRSGGKLLGVGDTRRAVELAYRAWPDVSPDRVAAQLGCPLRYVNRVRAALERRRRPPPHSGGSDGRRGAASRSGFPDAGSAAGDSAAVPSFAVDSVRSPPGVAPVAPSGAAPGSRGTVSDPTLLESDRGGLVSARPAGDSFERLVSVVTGSVWHLAAEPDRIDLAAVDRDRREVWSGELAVARRQLAVVISRLRRPRRRSAYSGAPGSALVGVEVAALLDSLGLTVGESGIGNVSSSVVLRLVHAAYGGALLGRVLCVLRDAFPVGPYRFARRLIQALAVVLDTYPSVDDDSLVAALSSAPDGVRSVYGRADHYRNLFRSLPVDCCAAAIVDIYIAAVPNQSRVSKWFTPDEAGRFRPAARFRSS